VLNQIHTPSDGKNKRKKNDQSGHELRAQSSRMGNGERIFYRE